MLRQPSLNGHSSPVSSKTAALIKTFLNPVNDGSSSANGEASTTNNRIDRPTCGAANPTPCAAYIVSNMFSISSFILGYSSGAIAVAFLRNTGSPYAMIGYFINSKSFRPHLNPLQRRGLFDALFLTVSL